MKNKIQKFAKGDFHLNRPEVVFDKTHLVLIIGEGELYRDNFKITNNKEGSIRGLVYTSSDRMHFKNDGFDGNPVLVELTYDGRGLKPGYVEKGKITVVCTGGEFELPFTAIMERPYVKTAYGKVQSTDDFRKLAITDYTEAARLFRSKDFYEILKYEDERILGLYDNMRKWSLGEQAMEEFLVGTKLKECLFLTLPEEGMLFEDVNSSVKGTISIVKNTWGYMPIQVEVMGAFLKLNKLAFTTEDFVGNNYELEYYVQPGALHGGRNYGRINLKTPYETLSYDVEVLQNQNDDSDRQESKFLCVQIMKEYLGCVTGNIEVKDWVERATANLTTLRKIDAQNDFYQLLQAHVYLIGHKNEEARWILENYNYNRFAIGKDPIMNAYYLYLTAVIQDDPGHTDRVTDEIGRTYLHHQDSWNLLYMLIQLDPRYKNATKRLEVLEEQFEFGTHGILFYLEVYRCYQEKLTLLKKLGKLELQVLNFASKYQLISREISLYVANLAIQMKTYSEPVFRILERIYDLYEEPTILNTIGTLLVKGNKTQKRYFKWYQRAVEAELKIAKLYEYYMAALDEEQVKGPLPKSVFLYFMHGNSLEYKKEAFLYANLLTYYGNDRQLFQGYRNQMMAFVWDQLQKRHITDSLRVLYKRFCVEEEMSEERLEAMLDICYAYSISTKIPDMKCVLVIEPDGQIRQRVAYEEDDTTVIFLYGKASRIIWESKEGRYYTDSIPYETKRLFYEPRFIEMCKNHGVSVDRWEKKEKSEGVTLENVQAKGLQDFRDRDVFRLLSRQIRETSYESDDFLIYLAFTLFQRQQYDKVSLTYLEDYYCGATSNMKQLWRTLKEEELPTDKVAERIITQMVFSEDLCGDEEIFVDYYTSGKAYFRLKQAYLAYVSRQYLLGGRRVGDQIFEIIVQEYEQQEELPDVCYIALLWHYSKQTMTEELELVLHKLLLELSEKQLIFPFYQNYPKKWVREAQIYDKEIIAYRAEEGACVKLFYKVQSGEEESLGYQCEVLMPMFDTMYVKQFVLFAGETLTYFFQEIREDGTINSEKKVLKKEGACGDGRYGRINEMLTMTPEKRKLAMMDFQEEERLAEDLFVLY